MPDSEKKSQIASRLLAKVKVDLGNAWNNLLTDADKTLIESCCQDAAELQLQALLPAGPDDAARLTREMGHVEAQLANIAAAVQTGLVEAFRQAFREIVHEVTSALLSLALRR